MKKVIYCLTIVALGLSVMVGCKPKNTPEEPGSDGKDSTVTPVDTTTTPVDTTTTPVDKKLTIVVSELTFSGALVTVTASDEVSPFYWDVISKEGSEGIDAAAFQANAEEMLEYYAAFGYEMTLEDIVVTGEDSYEYSSLKPQTEYVVVGAFYDAAAGKFVDPVTLKEFTTPALPEPTASENVISLEYKGDSILYITTTTNDDYYVEIMSTEYYALYLEEGYTDASIIEESVAYYTEYNDEYAMYFLFSGNYEYNFWADYGRELEAGEYVALVAGISNYQVSTEVFKLEFTLPDLGVVESDDDVVMDAPKKRDLRGLRSGKTFKPAVLKVRR